MKERFYQVLCIIGIVICILTLNKMSDNEYKKAINRCNGKDNVITSYTNQGDKYYSCKVDK